MTPRLPGFVAEAAGDAVIAPFGSPAAALPVLNVPLGAAVRAELKAAGLEAGAPGRGPALAVGPGVFVNAACLRALRAAAGPEGGRLVLRAPGWARLAGGPETREVDVAVLPADAPAADAPARARLAPVEIDADEKSFGLVRGGPESLDVAAPRLVAARVETWSDLLWLNLFVMASRVRNLPPAAGAGLVALASLRALSFNPWRIAGKLVEKGPGCDVHPKATVEASVLGRGVRIGPGAVVRGSILGDGVEVEELALVSGSVLGKNTRVQRFGMFKFSVAGEGCSTGGTVQLSVLGDGSATRGGSYTMDRRLDGTAVRVDGPGGRVEAGPALGAALGPNASIGSGVWLAPGRGIPAGAVITRGEQDVVTRIPAGLVPGVYAVVDGTLVSRRP